MKIIYLLKPSLQLKKERFWLFVIKILNVALFMNESRKIIKKDDPIGNEQWQSMSSKIQNYMINVFIGMDIILKTCLILMININLHYNLLKVHRFIRTHGLFSVNEQIICGSLSIYFDILPHIVSKKHFIIKSAFLNKILNNKICNLIIMYNITTMIFII